MVFTVEYTTNIFQDASTYSQHANKEDIDLQDIQLAIQERVNTSFTSAAPKEVTKNKEVYAYREREEANKGITLVSFGTGS